MAPEVAAAGGRGDLALPARIVLRFISDNRGGEEVDDRRVYFIYVQLFTFFVKVIHKISQCGPEFLLYDGIDEVSVSQEFRDIYKIDSV